MLSNALRLSLVAILPFAAACGGATPEPAAPGAPAPSSSVAPPSSASSPAADAAPLPSVWSSDLPKPQAIAFMKKNVVPRMIKAFQGHDAAKYASFDCKTCHGPQFQVPKDFLPRLTFKDGKLTAFADKPEIAKFMHEVVVPEMATAMGLPPYDPQTNKGFGCGGCHGVDMK